MREFHGRCYTPEYRAYQDAKNRCLNPKNRSYARYGGRGIQFLFVSFTEFLAEIGSRPVGKTLDRIDNDGPYAPGNVRWATVKEQATNKQQVGIWKNRQPRCRKQRGRWLAEIYIGGVRHPVGRFATKEEGLLAYQKKWEELKLVVVG